LSQEEKDNFVFIQTVLFNFGVKCVVDVNLVRGLDYYTDLVFEVKSNCVSGSLGGGGRYSNLIKEIGGNDCSCIGFGLGVERVMNVMIEQNIYIDDYGVDIFVAKIDDSVEEESFELIHSLRKNDFSVTSDFSKNKLSSLFSIAEKCKAKYIVIVGKKDIENGVFTVKNQKTLKQEIIKKNEILEYFKKNI
jgi:histidyl-tRNA synthetase